MESIVTAGTSQRDNSAVGHCAYCLVEIPGGKVQNCGQCKRRAYCGKLCQIKDWSSKGDGQGHKNWCKLGCGEEDIEWTVVPIKGKGLGIRAKCLIPAKFRIIVEAGCPANHSGVEDLMPIGGTFEQKYVLNRLGCGPDDDVQELLCLRISRANHNCDANAGHFYDSTYKVKILFAERDILPGEEICIAYCAFNDVSTSTSAQTCRIELLTAWFVDCPKDCLCHNTNLNKLIDESRVLDSEIFSLRSRGKTDLALAKIKKLLNNEEVICTGYMNKSRTLLDGFQIAIMKKRTVHVGIKHISQALEIYKSILHPKSAKILEMQAWKAHPEIHMNYLSEQ